MGPLDRFLRWVGLDFEVDLSEPPFDRITPALCLGARPTPDRIGALHEAGITDIVSCLPPKDRSSIAFLEGSFRTHFLPLHDRIDEDIASSFPTFFELVDHAGGSLLVHCQVGVSRSATLAVAQVMRESGLRFYEAYTEVRRRRPQVLPNIGFASQLQQLEHRLHGPRPSQPASLDRYLREVCNVPADSATLQEALEHHDYDAESAIRAVFGDIPRVVQGVRFR